MAVNNKRSNNFSKQEERQLLDLVCKYRHIIECKKTDTAMNRKKNEIWIELAKEFNAASGETYRDAKTLKNKYENLKKRTKHKVAEEKQAMFRTGGGPYTETKLDGTEQIIVDLLGVRAEGMETEFGDDAVLPPTNQEPLITIIDLGGDASTELNNLEQDHIEVTEPVPSTSGTQECSSQNGTQLNIGTWKKYTPDMLRQPTSRALKFRGTPKHKIRNSDVGVRIENWAASKIEFEDEKIRCFRREHELKIKQMEECHAKQLEVVQRESEQRMKLEKERHDIEVAILRKRLTKD